MQVTDKDLENVVPAVVEEFKAALEMKLMKFIMMQAATQEEVNDAFDQTCKCNAYVRLLQR